MKASESKPGIEKKIENMMTIINYSFGKTEFRTDRCAERVAELGQVFAYTLLYSNRNSGGPGDSEREVGESEWFAPNTHKSI